MSTQNGLFAFNNNQSLLLTSYYAYFHIGVLPFCNESELDDQLTGD